MNEKEWIDGWIYEWMNEQIDEWMDKWSIDRWSYHCIESDLNP